MSAVEREGWDEAHAAICGRGNRTCSAHRPGYWGHLLVDALARIFELEAQVAGLEAMNTEKAAEIRRLQRGNHPAGRALKQADLRPHTARVDRFVAETVDAETVDAEAAPTEADWLILREALTERDAEHEGGGA